MVSTGRFRVIRPARAGTEPLEYRPSLHPRQGKHGGVPIFCKEWTLVKRKDPGLAVVPLWCRSWPCDECRPGRTKRLVFEAKSGQPNLFITLTTRRRPGGSPAAAARALANAWRQVRREYVRVHGKGSLAFLSVFEETQHGSPHLHIVARGKWVDQRWLSKRMGALIDAPIVWVQAIDGAGQIAAYISKYIAKNPQRFAGTKRYWRSLDYLLPVAGFKAGAGAAEPRWQVIRRRWLAYVMGLAPDFDLIELGRNYATLAYRRPP